MTNFYMLKSKHSHKFLGKKPRIYTEAGVGSAFSNDHHKRSDFSEVRVEFSDNPDPINLGCVIQNALTGAYLCGHPRNEKVEESMTKAPRRYDNIESATIGITRRDDLKIEYRILWIKPINKRITLPGAE